MCIRDRSTAKRPRRLTRGCPPSQKSRAISRRTVCSGAMSPTCSARVCSLVRRCCRLATTAPAATGPRRIRARAHLRTH
eukprot:375088-Alexandrium_andersonii.AAC.1